MNKNDLSIATLSWARNNEEEWSLRTSLQALASLGLRVYITDGGSPGPFVRFLHGLPGFTVFQAKGLWPQVKQSISAAQASGARFILYTEPDKKAFFRQHLPQMLDLIDPGQRTGVVLASRSREGFASFPAFQQMTEETINRCCSVVTGLQTDYCYGPFLFHAQLVPFLNTIRDDAGWGWRPYLFALAQRLGWQLDVYEGSFLCPMDQRNEDPGEKIYRMKQLTQNIVGLVQAAGMQGSQ